MDAWLHAVEGMAAVQALRFSRWSYAALNTLHVAGLALLVGSAVPLALRLLGCWSTQPRGPLVRVLVPVAAFGLLLTVLTGMGLFATRAAEYGHMGLLWLKLALVAAGVGSALIAHMRHGAALDRLPRRAARMHGSISVVAWLGALVCGRMLAYAG